MNDSFWRGKKVLVTGGAGFIGSHVIANLTSLRGVARSDIVVPRSSALDLRDGQAAARAAQGCEVVIHLAAVTGGIDFSRAHPASQYRESTLIDLNVFEAARVAGAKKVVAVGNLFAYAADAPIPLRESDLFEGLPSASHRGVGLMKRNLATLADLYHREFELNAVVVYSANAYGPGDSIDPQRSHVIPGTIMKCLKDSRLVVWGDGSPTRDFLFAADVAEGIVLAAERLEPPNYINIGSSCETSIRELVTLIAEATNFEGPIEFDGSKPGGDPRRVTATDRARALVGFSPEVHIREGLRRTVDWYRSQVVRGD